MKTIKKIVLYSLFTALLFSCAGKEGKEDQASYLQDLETAEGLEVTLFASEPMFSNPTNMDIDAKGRVWVCEAYNYRNQYNPKNPVRPEGDRIMILEDTDGDGKADKTKVYYQGTDVNAALGIAVLGNKVIVSCSPNVFVFTDENGDDIPDKKEVFFQGIKGVQHDHAIHAFTFGHDGKLYFNMGNEGIVLVDAKGDTVRDVYGNRVFTKNGPYREGLALRCNMDGSSMEVLGHNFRNNYELAADPFGTVWQSDNDDDGNKGTRINYVMEHGNFGYRDEMTGASWSKRRTNMEKEIPLRHWHLNDPGVVPNMLQTGSGSPTGILVYEGTMLPERFRGQLIHAEPGHNVVRAYLVEKDGAGYKATVENLLKSKEDQWFRPADVTVAPDGSVFVADWYDPGVGGHQVGDVDKGRIYRISKKGSSYTVSKPDLTTAEGAIASLFSPNPATRFLGYNALLKMGTKAERALLKHWKGQDLRKRAQAFWLLAKLPNGDSYLTQALQDKDEEIRITGIRAHRQSGKAVLPVLASLSKDSSVQVRREAALALYGINSSEAAAVWTDLAIQYDGRDRWYLEALGIGAASNWDNCFAEWIGRMGENWNTQANSDIIWRSRSTGALPYLAKLIHQSDEQQMLRYYRAFDFHSPESRQPVLASLVEKEKGSKVLFALKHMDASKVKMSPGVRLALDRALTEQKGKYEFVELASTFRVYNRANDLLKLSIIYPDSAMGKEAMKVLLDWNRTDLIQKALNSRNKDQVTAVIKSVWPHMSNPAAIRLMEGVFMDESRDMEIRKLAVKTFGGPWQSEDHLLSMAREKRIPEPLHTSAAGVFQTAWRAALREEASKYLVLPGSKEGRSLPAISVLASRSGDAVKGREVFTNLCSTCHQVNKEGVNFGPDLSEIGKKLSEEAMYTSILFPDQGISFGFEGYRFKLNNGSTAFGRIVSETAEKVDVQFMQQTTSIPAEQIVSRVKIENSLMPSDLQQLMTEQELVDLVGYLQGLGK